MSRSILTLLLAALLALSATAEGLYTTGGGKLTFPIPDGWKVRTRKEKVLYLNKNHCSVIVLYRPTPSGYEKEKRRLSELMEKSGKRLHHQTLPDHPQFESVTQRIWLTEGGKTVSTVDYYKLPSGGGLLLATVFYKNSPEELNDEMKRMSKSFKLVAPNKPKPAPVSAPQPVTTPTPQSAPEEPLDF